MYFLYGILFIVSFIAILLAIIAKYRLVHFKLSFIFLMICIAIWSFGYALELKNVTIEEKIFWAKFEYFGIASIPLAWLLLVLQYSGRKKVLIPKNIALLSLEPIITILLVWTNEYHHLIWKSIGLKNYANFSLLVFDYGFWAKIHITYVYLLLSFAIFILLQIFVYSYHYYKKQAVALLFASFIPWIGNMAYVLNFSYIDPTPFAFLITGIIFAYLIQFRMLDIIPIAREKIIENMKDAVIALDKNLKILYLNPAATKLFGIKVNKIIGENVDLLANLHPKLPKLCRKANEELKIRNRYYELQSSPLFDDYGDIIGYFVILRDITERKIAEKKLEETLEMERDLKLKTAHYFFNPICIAKGFLILAREEGINGKIQKAIEAIERIEKVVKNIIHKGKIEE